MKRAENFQKRKILEKIEEDEERIEQIRLEKENIYQRKL
jgi:hypothetical protein